MTTQTKKYFAFDLDDTLVDGREFCGETIARVITHFEPDADFYKIIKLHEDMHGRSILDLYENILKEIGLYEKNKSQLNRFLDMDRKIQMEDIHKLKIFDGVIDILKFLKSQDKMVYMVTNRIGSLLKLALKHNEIEEYFDEIISCVDQGHKKPDPTCILNLIEKNNARKDEFIYFGDSIVDTELARNAGIEHIVFDQYLNDKNIFKKLINMFLEEKINGFK